MRKEDTNVSAPMDLILYQVEMDVLIDGKEHVIWTSEGLQQGIMCVAQDLEKKLEGLLVAVGQVKLGVQIVKNVQLLDPSSIRLCVLEEVAINQMRKQ